jgi:hypothetical protein
MKARRNVTIILAVCALLSFELSDADAESAERIPFRQGVLSEANSYDLVGVTSGDHKFVAVGRREWGEAYQPNYRTFGIVLLSEDGLHWEPVHTNDVMVIAVAHTTGRFIALAQGGGILASTDGKQWNLTASSEPLTLRSLTHGNGSWVAVGDGGLIAISHDGVNWTFLENPVDSNISLSAVAFGNGRFVAVGTHHLGYGFSSVDGVTWFVTELPKLSYSPRGIAYGNGMFLTLGASGRVDVSTDGLTWVRTTLRDRDWDSQNLIYAEGRFLVAIKDGILSSRDGRTWVRDYLRAIRRDIYSLAYDNGRYVAVGLDGLLLLSDHSRPYIDKIESRNGFIDISMSGGTDKRYVIESSSNLRFPFWNSIGEVLISDGVGSVRINAGKAAAEYFYRLAPMSSLD